MLTLGIDPGTATTGYGLVKMTGNQLKMIEYGCIKTAKDLSPAVRLQMIYKELNVLIKKLKPDELSIEQLFFNKNITTAISVAQARGVILLCAAQNDLLCGEYTPPQIKLAVTGYGKAEKKQVQYMVQKLLCLEKIPKPDDAADALAVAICHLHSRTLSYRA
ncbi:MAG: crossover junction endodeoxyribonuclease RuvC [Candidatus Margulisiibacteriota bacterium]|jgi:crossover junction endodeoxyribonuclease RuvC